MNILLYGHKGWIGGYVKQYLDKCNILYYESKFRVDDEKNISNEILTINPTHLLCLIGRTHGVIDDKVYTTIDYLEQPDKLHENIKDNLYSPLTLAILAHKHNKHLTYLGTGCIFNYDDNHVLDNNGFNENDIPNFFGSSYSIVKGFTDRLMHLFDNNVLNLRIRMPITVDLSSRNFITKILNYKKICSIPNSMSVLPDLIPIMIEMMTNNELGTFNFTNPGLISHNEILELYKEYKDNNYTWENFTIEEQNLILDSKRSNNYLDTTKLENKYNITHIKDSIKNIISKL
jgi:nucleoside-diphosphate-sugar epimerase